MVYSDPSQPRIIYEEGVRLVQVSTGLRPPFRKDRSPFRTRFRTTVLSRKVSSVLGPHRPTVLLLPSDRSRPSGPKLPGTYSSSSGTGTDPSRSLRRVSILFWWFHH